MTLNVNNKISIAKFSSDERRYKKQGNEIDAKSKLKIQLLIVEADERLQKLEKTTMLLGTSSAGYHIWSKA